MRRFLKPALVTLGAAAATFAVVSQVTGTPTAVVPAARTKASCQMAAPKAVVTTLVPINLPTLPTIPPVNVPTLPCIPAPTIPPLPIVTLPTLPSITLPTVTLPTIPDIVIPLPDFFPTTTSTTTDSCELSASAVVSVAC